MTLSVHEQDPQEDCIKDLQVFFYSHPDSVLERHLVSPILSAYLWRSL